MPNKQNMSIQDRANALMANAADNPVSKALLQQAQTRQPQTAGSYQRGSTAGGGVCECGPGPAPANNNNVCQPCHADMGLHGLQARCEIILLSGDGSIKRARAGIVQDLSLRGGFGYISRDVLPTEFVAGGATTALNINNGGLAGQEALVGAVLIEISQQQQSSQRAWYNIAIDGYQFRDPASYNQEPSPPSPDPGPDYSREFSLGVVGSARFLVIPTYQDDNARTFFAPLLTRENPGGTANVTATITADITSGFNSSRDTAFFTPITVGSPSWKNLLTRGAA